jgi:4a-hydroxytetrahydrobiopterin dehydratase
MNELSAMNCVPCKGGVPPLTPDQIAPLHAQLSGWHVFDHHHLKKTWAFPDFLSALDFVNRIGELAEAEGHHPDIFLTWGKVGVEIFTHKIDGLSESDFVLAAKIDEILVDAA